MKYNKIETLNHIVSKSFSCCVKDFNEIILNEDDLLTVKPTFFSDVDVIDLDCVELNLARSQKRNQNSTMDSSFAISDKSNLEMLLVELRFNYTNLSNLSRQKLLDKVSGSISVLGNTVKINNTYIFIFQPNLVEQATNRFRRMVPIIPNNYVAMDLTELISKYF